MRVLSLNAGSNSLKFAVLDVPSQDVGSGIRWGRSMLSGVCDDIGKKSSRYEFSSGEQVIESQDAEVLDHESASTLLIDWIENGAGRPYGIGSMADIDCIAHRIVHGADQFAQSVLISDEVIEQILALEELAPLHNEPAARVIEASRERVGHEFPMFAIFDTAYHRSIPDRAALYALPLDLARRHRIRRYGFHGISHHYLALRFSELSGRPLESLKLITLHLEGGSSAAAIRDGVSIDTSMGFTPIEGLMMGTRCGDIDPAMVTYLMRKERWTVDEVDRFLNKQCGLLGVSGVSADTRELRSRASDPHVELALDMFSYRVLKYIGAYLAALGGADAVIFGGGIGENTAMVRQRICSELGWCGATLDERRNAAVIDQEGCISTSDSHMSLWVIPTNETLMMAHYAAAGAD
jgi:acetate kinase